MEPIKLAEQVFFSNSDLTYANIEKILASTINKSINYADLYLQEISSESWYLEDSIVKSGSYNVDKGFGFRAVAQDKASLAFAENINLFNLRQASLATKNIAYANIDKNNNIINKNNNKNLNLYPINNPLLSIPDNEKIKLLTTIDKLARANNNISQVTASLTGTFEIVLIINHNNLITADVRPLIRLNIKIIAEDKTKNLRTQGISGGGGRFADYSMFIENDYALTKNYIKQAVDLALLNLTAQDAPAGTMPVVLGSGWPGILLHEAIGHGLEGDAIYKKTSVFYDKLGEQIASPLCTIVDNGCITNRRGSLNIDDEGITTQNTVLIENGILKNFMQDQMNANLMQHKPTGNARRESYAYLPMPRMTNTYMLAGKHEPKDIIKTVTNGIYAVNFSGGQVDITSGKFVFEASEAYLIKNGKITTPIKGATLIGSGAEVLKQISMVGNDLNLDPGIGTCGKDGQYVPVGVGQPTLLVQELTVGGTKC